MDQEARTFPALVVHQWLSQWDSARFDEDEFQAKPNPNYLMLSMPAGVLRRLSNTYRRAAGSGAPRQEDTGVQRKHDEDRSDEIARFVKDGYPLSSLSKAKREKADAELLRKPGWLPTAIVVNILDPSTPRAGRLVDSGDALRVPPAAEWKRGELVEVGLPENWTDDWAPSGAFPIEVIDGQHRLWSFENSLDDDFDLPVVAFFGLDISWQAYLFWTINIKPKKINASLAYDLYPLLRDQEWLLAGEGIDVYRETRSQELTEALWLHPQSPWHDRINMLGETGLKTTQPVTQAAFVRSIAEAFVRSWIPRGSSIGGLFGGARDGSGLGWSRAQQAAFLIQSWRSLATAVSESTAPWAVALRSFSEGTLWQETGSWDNDDAFGGRYSLLASDQGVRAFHQALNDFFFLAADDLALRSWTSSSETDDTSIMAINAELETLDHLPFKVVLDNFGRSLAKFDWRNAATPDLQGTELLSKQALRGTGGYKILREGILRETSTSPDPTIAELSSAALKARS